MLHRILVRPRLILLVAALLVLSFSYAQSNKGDPPPDEPMYRNDENCAPAQYARSNYANIWVFPNDTVEQSEITIAHGPGDPAQLLVGARTHTLVYDPCCFDELGGPCAPCYKLDTDLGYYQSVDGGISWIGADTLPDAAGYGVDPTVAYASPDTVYYSFLGLPFTTQYVSASFSGGESWNDQRTAVREHAYRPDKSHLAVDTVSGSARRGDVYVAWLNGTGLPALYFNIEFARSTDGGQTFVDLQSISDSLTDFECFGVKLAVAPSGRVYAAFNVFDGDPDHDKTEDAIGFNRSTPAGETFSFNAAADRIVEIEGIGKAHTDSSLAPKQMRVNSNPVMAMDTVGGVDGTIYLVWADRRHGDADILLIRSDDGGVTWDSTDNPIRVNQDTKGNGRDQWFPWITVTPDGEVYVVFFDCRNDVDNYMTEAWVARSTDGGESFEDFRVSDVAFAPCVIDQSTHYMGDYLGITSTSDYVYAAWNDSRHLPPGLNRGVFQLVCGADSPGH